MIVPKGEATPCAALFDMMKRYGGISGKELASLILSGRPLPDGRSPMSRIDDRAWLSRYIVHAPVGTVQEHYFSDFPSASLRVAARLKSKKRNPLNSAQILEMIAGEKGQEMVTALAECHQDVALYRNVLNRLTCESGFTMTERAEMALVLLMTAGCTANVQRAVSQVMEFAKAVHGTGMATPLVTPTFPDAQVDVHKGESVPQTTLGLMRIVDGYVAGSPFWLDPTEAGVEIGALTLGSNAITEVAPDVSSKHLRIWRDASGEWFAQGLGSTHGTVLISGVDHAQCVIEPPRSERTSNESSEPVAIHPGDEIIMASNTRFLVLEGIPSL